MAIDIDRYARQADLVPRDRFADMTASVIGVGAVGRQVALQLAAIGVRHLQLIDYDSVEPSNVTTQGYRQSDIGRSKVAALQQSIAELDPTTEVATVFDQYRPKTEWARPFFAASIRFLPGQPSGGRQARFVGSGRTDACLEKPYASWWWPMNKVAIIIPRRCFPRPTHNVDHAQPEAPSMRPRSRRASWCINSLAGSVICRSISIRHSISWQVNGACS